MKIFISLFILFNFLAAPVFSEELQGTVDKMNSKTHKNTKIVVPEFSEFAPPQYVNAKPVSKTVTSIERAFSKIFIISLVGMPIGLLMKENVDLREKNNKWADRKFNFENSIKYCQALEYTDEIKACYKNLRKIELYKNADKTRGDIKLQSKF